MRVLRYMTRVLAVLVCLAVALQCMAGCGLAFVASNLPDEELPRITAEPLAETTKEEVGTTAEPPTESSREPETAIGTEAPAPPEEEAAPKYHIGHPELTYSFDSEQEKKLLASMEELEKMVEGETAEAEEFLAFYESVETDMFALRTQNQLAYVETFLYKTDEAVSADYLYVSELFHALLQRFVRLYRSIEDSVYGEAFYADWSEEEKTETLASADIYDAECAALQIRLDAIEQEQRLLSETEYEAKSEELYREMLTVGSDLAKKLGYGGYVEYAYDALYGRDYTPSDVGRILTYAREAFPQILTDAVSDLGEIKLTREDTATLYAILHESFESDFGRTILDNYYQTLGGELYAEYRSFWESGYYYVAYDAELSEAGAFTFYLDSEETPAVYFGPGYGDLFTFVHEFGHYYHYVKCGGEGELSLDLAETHSQGDEWLFLVYLCETVYPDSAVADYLRSYYTANSLLSLMICLMVDEFEQICYTDGGKTVSGRELDEVYVEVADAVWSYGELAALLGYPPEDYWRRVVIESPVYYVSYAVSQLAAMELYAEALSDFEAAAGIYTQLQAEEGGFLSVLAAVGLTSPFDEALYTVLSDALSAN